jgi:hypothetical protein
LISVVNKAVAPLRSASLEIERINRVSEVVPGIESEEDKLAMLHKLSKLLTLFFVLCLLYFFRQLRLLKLHKSDRQFSEKCLGISDDVDENSCIRSLGEFCKGAVNALHISS